MNWEKVTTTHIADKEFVPRTHKEKNSKPNRQGPPPRETHGETLRPASLVTRTASALSRGARDDHRGLCSEQTPRPCAQEREGAVCAASAWTEAGATAHPGGTLMARDRPAPGHRPAVRKNESSSHNNGDETWGQN